jgi:iron complex transport system substrate-binding protein
MTYSRSTSPADRTGRSRRALPAAALALSCTLTLAACGGPGGSGSGSAGGTKAKHPVKTSKGTVSVPDHPRRVVVLDSAELDSAITLGVEPVGATRPDAGKSALSYLPRDKTKGIANVGTIGQPNLEKIAELKPDLILTSAVRDGKNYDKLKAIAPTVMTESTGYPWKQNFRVHADALGRKAKAKKVVGDYHAHARRVTKALGGAERAKSLRTNVVRFQQGADTRIYGDKSYIATVLKDAGLGRPPVVKQATDYGGLALDVSPEKIDKADADVVFYSSYGPPAKSGQTKAVKGPLWKDMGAVKRHRAFAVDDELWIQGIGYTAADKILDEVQHDLAG